jgi:glycosyltransferase involved in cell wall biosynthesis
LDSIPRRDDIQIIVVDDNSDDDKVTFENFPGLNDPFVEVVFTKEGKGAGYARNIGLTRAKGKWLIFADADDFFNDCFLPTIDKYCNADADTVYFAPNSVDSDTLEPSNRGVQFQELICLAERGNNLDLLRYKYYVPHSKMIKRILVAENSIKFSETLANNDCYFSVKTGHHSKKIQFENIPIYCLTTRSDSLINNYSPKIAYDRLYAAVETNTYLELIGKGKFRINAIPYLFSRRVPKGKHLYLRLRILTFGYFFKWFFYDAFVLAKYFIWKGGKYH